MLNRRGPLGRALLIGLSAYWCAVPAAAPADDGGAELPVAAEPSVPDIEPAAEASPAATDRLDVAAILSGALTEEDYAEEQMCVSPRDLDSIEVLDEHLVLFYGRRGEIWLNQLSSQCLGLTPDMVLDIRSYGGSFCRLDRFRGTPRFDAFLHLTAECRLGTFETIAEPHAEALRTAAAERREAGGAAAKTREAR